MRVLFQVSLDTHAANRLAKEGKLGETINEILEETQPESAYFGVGDGQRKAFMVVEMEGPHRIPDICEPWFLAFDAGVDFQPVMVQSDLADAAPAIEKAAKKYA